MDNKEFTVTVPKIYTFKEGWGVDVIPLWGYSEELDDPEEFGYVEPDVVSDIKVSVVRITEDQIFIAGELPCIEVGVNGYVPVENFKDVEDLTVGDTHDLRSRWFATEQGARNHAEYTLNRWKHPQVGNLSWNLVKWIRNTTFHLRKLNL